MKSKKKQRLLALILSMVLMLSASMEMFRPKHPELRPRRTRRQHRVWNKRQYRKPR